MSRNGETESIAEKGVTRAILLFGIPLVLGMGFHALFNLVDLWIVGKLGTNALAAVTIASMINTIPMVICNGISTSTIAFMARSIGFNNLERANEVMRQSFLLVIGMSIVLGLLPYFYAEKLVISLQASGPDVIDPAREYLQVVSLGTITMFLLMQITASLRAVGDGVWPMILLLGANILNIVLDWALVFGKWGFPNLGAPGAAWATVISRGVFCFVGLWVLWRGKGGIRLTTRKFRIRVKLIWRLIAVGFPCSAQLTVRLVAYLAILWIVGDYHATHRPEFGNTAQAAFGVGLRLDVFAIFAGFGWGAAAATLVGQNLGRGLPERAARSTWIAAWFNVIMMAGMGAAYYIFAPFLIRFFGADTEIMEVAHSGKESFEAVVVIGTEYLRIAVFSYVFIALSVALSHGLNGAGSTRTPMFIDTVGLLLIQLPLAYFLSRSSGSGGEAAWWHLGLRGVWYSIVVSNALIAGVYVILFRMGRWKRKVLW